MIEIYEEAKALALKADLESEKYIDKEDNASVLIGFELLAFAEMVSNWTRLMKMKGNVS